MSNEPTIPIRYTCFKCHLLHRVFQGPTRNYNEDVLVYMHRLAVAMTEDHNEQSPGCSPDKFYDVWIPVKENQPIGTEIADAN